jgi:formylglycine-generating enzyme required for sulfatase activity
MYIKTKCIYPAFFALLLLGCGPTSNIILKYQHDQNFKLSYSLSSAPQVEVPDEVLEAMRSQIEKILSEQNLLATKGDDKFHKADIFITHYRMRPDVARLLVGIMAGCDKIISKVTVVNLKTTDIVGMAEFESNECAAWEVASQVIEAHIRKIADYFKQGGAETMSSSIEKPASSPVVGTRTSNVSRDQTKEMEMVFVKGGCYPMGDTFGDFGEADTDEKPVHEVCVDDFYIGKYEVTQGQWQGVMGNNPSYFKNCGNTCPVEQVSWNDVQDFIGILSAYP